MSTLSSEENDALSDYKSGNAEIRHFIRMNLSEQENPEVFETIKHIRSALEKSLTASEMVLWRGTNENEIENNRSGICGEIEEPFFSTSTKLKAAAAFINERDPAILKIKIPQNYNAVKIKGKARWAKDEEEFLLKGNSHFKIIEERTIDDLNLFQKCGLLKKDIHKVKFYTIELS